jgi:RNA polymerase sigma-70 factor (ECF subfamily)
LFRKIFDYDYDEIAQVLERTETSCRQLVSRAEAKVLERKAKFEPPPSDAQRITGAFLKACSTGDLNGLVELLAHDAVLYSDGGGKALAARAPIYGSDRIARFFCGISKKAAWAAHTRWIRVNGQPGVLTTYQGAPYSVTTFHIVEGRIVEVYIIRNPDKLPALDDENAGPESAGDV